jgi:hypothetical protein
MYFEMPHLAKAIQKSIEKFDKIVGNTTIHKGGKYDQVKLMIINALWEKDPFVFNSTQEARLGFAALSFEPNLVENVLNANRFLEFIEVSMKTSDRLTKSMLGFYYRKYASLENNSQKVYLTESLKRLVRQYAGRNPMVIKAKEDAKILDGRLHDLLEAYGNIDIKIIKQNLYLSEVDEFYERLRLIKLLEEVKKLPLGENNQILFQQLYEARDVSASGERNMGEESVLILLSKCKSNNDKVSTEWINFILKIVGDPRSVQNQYAWNRIGLSFKDWLISTLSQGDLVEFLNIITDGQGDEIYRYRKAFWMKFVKHVKYAKIMINEKEILSLKRINSDFYKRFIENPTTYSTLKDRDRSCIYMDFGALKVIEGTHNAKIRIYTDCPIKLNSSSYSYDDFYIPSQAKNVLEYEKNHSSSNHYSWQNDILNFMNQYLGLNVELSDVVLPEDKEHNFSKIIDFLTRNNHELRHLGKII